MLLARSGSEKETKKIKTMNIYATGVFDKIVSAQRRNGFKYADATDSVTPAPGTDTVTTPTSSTITSAVTSPTVTPTTSTASETTSSVTPTPKTSTSSNDTSPRTILVSTLPVGLYNPDLSMPRYVTNTPNMVNTPFSEESARGSGGGGGGSESGPEEAVNKAKSKKGFVLVGLLLALGVGAYYKLNN